MTAETIEKPTRKTRGKKPKEPAVRRVMRIAVEDLVVGDLIATVTRYSDKHGCEVADKTRKVEQKDLCPSQWRTHIHVNRDACYDTRQHIKVVV